MVRKIVGFILSLVLGLGNLLSFTSAVNAEEAGKIWLNDDNTVTYTTINDAVAAGHTGDIIRVSGTFDTTNTAFRDAVVNNDMTLEFVGNTVILSDNSLQHGLTIASGSHIKTVNGSTLTMKGFNTALNLQVGSEMNDGLYTFENNEKNRNSLSLKMSLMWTLEQEKIEKVKVLNDKKMVEFIELDRSELKVLAKKIQDIVEVADMAEQMAVVGISRYTIEQMLNLNVKDFFRN